MKKKTPPTRHGGPIGSEQRSPNWGGARDGAGRPKGTTKPPDPAARTAVGWYRVTRHVADNIETAANLDGVGAADVVAAALSSRFRCSCEACRRARRAIPKRAPKCWADERQRHDELTEDRKR